MSRRPPAKRTGARKPHADPRSRDPRARDTRDARKSHGKAGDARKQDPRDRRSNDARGPQRDQAQGKRTRAHQGRDPHARDPHARRTADARGQGKHAQPRGQAVHPAHGAPKARGQETPARGEPRDLGADALLRNKQPLRPGEWLWTMREGAERDLVEELVLHGGLSPRGVAAALVASRAAPGARDARLDVTFARQGFPIAAVSEAQAEAQAAAELAPALVLALRNALNEAQSYVLQVFVPDSTEANPLAARAQAIEAALAAQLEAALPDAKRSDEAELRRLSLPLVQVCVYAPDRAAAGVLPSDRALSLAPGGRTRVRLAGDFPSRAARKLEEALSWLGMSPGVGELCVDLGAAPGGWSWLLLEKKRARVIAVDPARMDPKLAQNRRLSHVQGSAFEYAPDEPVDWLFCDMAWRPAEVAQMLARWARRRYARHLVANFKLPMKRKAETVQQLREVLAEGGYVDIRTRQLYHDREEITLSAHVH